MYLRPISSALLGMQAFVLCQHPPCAHSAVLRGATVTHADKKGTDAENAIRAVAEALQMVIVVGTGQHAQSYGSQHSTPAWSK